MGAEAVWQKHQRFGRGCEEPTTWGQQCWSTLQPAPICASVLQAPSPLMQQHTDLCAPELFPPVQNGSTVQRRTAGEKLKEKLCAGKETSAPARPILGMRQPKGSIRLLETRPYRWSQNLTRQRTARPYTHPRLPGTSHSRPAPTGPGAASLFPFLGHPRGSSSTPSPGERWQGAMRSLLLQYLTLILFVAIFCPLRPWRMGNCCTADHVYAHLQAVTPPQDDDDAPGAVPVMGFFSPAAL